MKIVYLISHSCYNFIIALWLWDYSDRWGNIQRIICPLFSLIWAVLGVVYYFLIHPHILDALRWLTQNLAFSFVIGVFFGVFIVDMTKFVQLVAQLKKCAKENAVIIRYENLKAHVCSIQGTVAQWHHFFRFFNSE